MAGEMTRKSEEIACHLPQCRGARSLLSETPTHASCTNGALARRARLIRSDCTCRIGGAMHAYTGRAELLERCWCTSLARRALRAPWSDHTRVCQLTLSDTIICRPRTSLITEIEGKQVAGCIELARTTAELYSHCRWESMNGATAFQARLRETRRYL